MTRSLLKVGVSAVLSAIFILLVIYRFLAIRSRQGEGEKKVCSSFVVPRSFSSAKITSDSRFGANRTLRIT